ncbi:MAG: selenocysteine-specific translation elongation factor [Candidatus Omnitrophica bacterium]|nr:selenocysteine-specific translation elongation factor [Candidatus Omnitrophota bacterium]
MTTLIAPKLDIVPVMVGTAGHVDHGKTALVRHLTGCETDCLPEEQKRGMSIDLGFAPFRLPGDRMVGIIDVPGHEDFIRNMVAGASSIDVLILVVAADDGIMPQTIEHLKIVTLLGRPQVMVVITKVDLATHGRQLEVKEYVTALLIEHGFAQAPVVMMSNKTGAGLDDVKRAIEQLVRLAEDVPARERAFRMHIERVFSPPGVGSVVAGIPSAGSCAVGEKLELFPGPLPTAARAIQKYGLDAPDSQAHVCTAITLRDIKSADLERGMTLAVPGVYHETLSAVLSIENVHATASIKRRQEMRFCCGTFTRVVWGLLLAEGPLKPGEKGFIQVESSTPMVLAAGDRFLLRSLSPSATIAGGSVLTTHVDPRRKRIYLTPQRLELARKAVDSNDPFLSELIAGAFVVLHDADLPGLVQVTGAAMRGSIDAKVSTGVLTALTPSLWLVTERATELEARLVVALGRYHKENKASMGMPGTQACTVLGLNDQCLDAVVRVFARSPLIVAQRNCFALKSFRPELSARQQVLKEKIMAGVMHAENAAVAFAPLQAELKATDQEMQVLLRILSEEGSITVLDHYWIASSAVHKYLAKLLELFRNKRIIELADFRTATGLSRNLAVPVLEYFDVKGITCREGKGRRLLSKSLTGAGYA